MVPEARLELARLERRGILNPLCLPIPPLGQIGAGNEARTRDPDLGKVVLYQLSYSRKKVVRILRIFKWLSISISAKKVRLSKKPPFPDFPYA